MYEPVATDVDGSDLDAIRAYAIARLERELSPALCYHSLWHTQAEVAPRAIWLAQREGLKQQAVALVAAAAYLHDIGFTVACADHEQIGAEVAAEVLPQFGYTPDQIAIIQDTILATRIPQRPLTLLGQILADADLDVLGRQDFPVRNRALRSELAAAGVTNADAVWYARQLQFLDRHHYFTPTARRDRTTGKAENRAHLHEIIRDCCPRVLDAEAMSPPLHGLAVPGTLPAASPTSPFGGLGLVLSPSLR
jgi:uncharacterized protein